MRHAYTPNPLKTLIVYEIKVCYLNLRLLRRYTWHVLSVCFFFTKNLCWTRLDQFGKHFLAKFLTLQRQLSNEIFDRKSFNCLKGVPFDVTIPSLQVFFNSSVELFHSNEGIDVYLRRNPFFSKQVEDKLKPTQLYFANSPICRISNNF